MHPIERLRHVARAVGAPDESIFHEAASSLVHFADDPPALVAAARRLVDRHPGNGPLWWLAANMLTSIDPAETARTCVEQFHADPTLEQVSTALPPDARVSIVGWPPRLAEAFGPRGDVEVRVVDVEGDGPGFVRLLDDLDVTAIDVDVIGMGGAVASSDLVLVEASVIGPEVAVTPSGSWPIAAVARTSAVPVWLVGGVGRAVGASTWPAVFGRLAGGATAPWEHDSDHLPLTLVDRVFGADEAVEAPELTR